MDFKADLIVSSPTRIDVILGMDWLSTHGGVIKWEHKTVSLTSRMGEKIEVIAIDPTIEDYRINHLENNYVDPHRAVEEFPDVFPDELPGMPPKRDIEFLFELLLGTAPIAKRPYRMGANELEELKK